MAIQTVRAKVNGTWHSLTYNASTSKWEGTITAPGATSRHLTGGYYPVEVEATNTAGTSATATAGDLAGLRLVVRETVAPVITMLSPTSGAYVASSAQPIVFTLTDETGGSGVDLSTLSVKVDGTAQTDISSTAITGGYSCTVTPSTLSDGAHTVAVNVRDLDGNAALQKSVTFTVDTVPPVLNLSSPPEGLITNKNAVTVAGMTNDATSSPVTVTVNGAVVSVGADGAFSKSVVLSAGENTITVIAADAAGKTTTISRTVTLDLSVPQIRSAAIAPNPADAGASILIAVEIA